MTIIEFVTGVVNQEHGLFESAVVQMKSTDGNNVSYFKVGFPPRSKN